MRVNFKPFPIAPHPAFPSQTVQWRPILNVVMFYQHARSRRIEAIVDSGSDYCLFHASIGESLGIITRGGIPASVGGVIGGVKGELYYHRIRLLAAGESYDIMAGFSPTLSVPALLGRVGFFDNFIVAFDNTPDPPCFDVQKIQRN
ncbi:MAG: hypothetical protein HYW04_07555 [Deltaproteobacteria bacterium]|nr:hypothetical protein [Deltaproteobacteria bacterium]